MKINKEYKEYLDDKETDIIVLIGGGASGKSFFVLQQWMPLKIIQEENIRVLVLRKIANTLENSVIQGVLDAFEAIGLIEDKHYKHNKSKNRITLLVNVNGKKTKGNYIAFAGLDDPSKIKSFTGLTHIIGEEAGEFTKKDFMEISIRTRPKRGDVENIKPQKIFMLNPVNKKHPIEEMINGEDEEIYKVFSDKDVEGLTEEDKSTIYKKKKKWILRVGGITTKVFRSTYMDNKFADETTKATIDNFKKYDYNEFRRYRLGLPEILNEIIFQKYRVEELNIDDEATIKKYGMDFGFRVDPTTLIESRIINDEILYIYNEHIYATGLTNDDIIDIIKEKELSQEYIVADSAEPKTIDQLQRGGLIVEGAVKGPGSIRSGIKKMLGYQIVIHPRCKNVINEFENYRNKVDKHGNVTDIIVDKDNHAIDAIRYSIEGEASRFIY